MLGQERGGVDAQSLEDSVRVVEESQQFRLIVSTVAEIHAPPGDREAGDGGGGQHCPLPRAAQKFDGHPDQHGGEQDVKRRPQHRRHRQPGRRQARPDQGRRPAGGSQTRLTVQQQADAEEERDVGQHERAVLHEQGIDAGRPRHQHRDPVGDGLLQRGVQQPESAGRQCEIQ